MFRIFLLLFLQLISFSIFSQNLFYRSFGVENGLSQSIVFCLHQDHLNQIWIGTIGGGIDIYNGNQFVNLSKGNGLPSNMIHHIMQDQNKTYWIATDNGLVKISLTQNKIYTTDDGLPSNNIWSVIQIEKNEYWIATDNGIAILKDNKIQIPKFLSTLANSKVFSLYKDNKQRIWMGTFVNGLFYYDHQKVVSVTDSVGNPLKTVWTINEDNVGNIFIGTSQGGFLFLNNGTLKKIVGTSTITSSIKIKDELIACLYLGEFIKINNGSIKQDIMYPIKSIRSILLDKEQNLWIGSENGLYQFPKTPYINWNQNQGLLEKSVYSICKGYGPGEWWIGFDNLGVCYVKTKNFAVKEVKPILQIGQIIKNNPKINRKKIKGISGSFITSIIIDNVGKTWFGTLTGISIFNPKDSSFWHINNVVDKDYYHNLVFPSMNKSVNHLSKDDNGYIWVATLNGIYIFNDTAMQSLPSALNELKNSIYYILHDKENIKWICTDKGLYKFDAHLNKLKHYGANEGFTDANVTSIIKDAKNNYWLATKEGIYFFDGKKFKNFNKSVNNLNSDNIYVLTTDLKNNFLIAGTNKGLNKIDLNYFYQKDSLLVKTYSLNDGFLGQDCNRNAVYVDSLNNIYIGTTNGVTIYKINEESINNIKPKILIHKILYNFQEFDWSQYCDSINPETKLPQNLVLPYNKNHLTFQFDAISFKNPEKVHYQFKMVGLDDNWSPIMKKNEADFPSLPPGNYTFLIRASNEDGIWSDPVEYKFVIKPPFYKTWWFITSVIILIIIGIIVFIKYRERSLIKEKQRLESIVKERTAEVVQQKEIVEQKNKDITDSINYARNIQEALLPAFEEIKQFFPDSFILYLPRDIVSGDFYWISQKQNKIYFAIADCTGHGVPGAFMSMLGITFLDEIVSNNPQLPANEILNKLRYEIILSLKQNEKESTSKDGMDISFIIFDKASNILEYAGANNPLYLIYDDSNEIEEIKADKMPIGKHITNESFTNHIIHLNRNMSIYMFSDGYADQFGGPKKKKFKYQSLKQLIIEQHLLPANQQVHVFRQRFYEWKGNLEQVDDVLLCCIKFNVNKS